MTRTCADCGTPVSRRATRCTPCAAAERGLSQRGTARPGSRRPRAIDRPIPADFAQVAHGMSMAQLKKRYSCRSESITRWRAEAGVQPLAPGGRAPECVPTPVPDDFAQIAPTLRMFSLCAHFARSPRIVRRWIAETGIRPMERPAAPKRNVSTRPMGMVVKIHHDPRDHSAAGQAADYLRRYGPVARCNAGGRYDPKGDHWRRGSTVLAADEIIARAKRQGWQPDAWKRVV